MLKEKMKQAEFEQRRESQIKALGATMAKPAVKTIELIEFLLEQDPGLPVPVQYGNHQFLVTSVRIDAEGRVRLYI